MKKILLVLVVVSAFACNSFAQTSKDASGKFSIGIDPGLPVGDASDAYNFGLGLDLKYDLPIAQSTFFNVSVGYTALFTKSDLKAFGYNSTYGFVPIKVGVKYYVNDAFFVEGQLGATVGTGDVSGTGFAYAPGVGYKFSDSIEGGIRYEGWSKDGTTSQLALRIAFNLQ